MELNTDFFDDPDNVFTSLTNELYGHQIGGGTKPKGTSRATAPPDILNTPSRGLRSKINPTPKALALYGTEAADRKKHTALDETDELPTLKTRPKPRPKNGAKKDSKSKQGETSKEGAIDKIKANVPATGKIAKGDNPEACDTVSVKSPPELKAAKVVPKTLSKKKPRSIKNPQPKEPETTNTKTKVSKSKGKAKQTTEISSDSSSSASANSDSDTESEDEDKTSASSKTDTDTDTSTGSDTDTESNSSSSANDKGKDRIHPNQSKRGQSPQSVHAPTTSKSANLQGGRPSAQRKADLDKGISQLSQLLATIAQETGFRPDRIIDEFLERNGRASNLWNIYQQYLQAHFNQEMQRLPENERLEEGDQVPTRLARQLYELFKEQTLTDGTELLRSWRRAEELDDSNVSFRERDLGFHSWCSRAKKLLKEGAEVWSFDSMLIASGRVVNQDQSLCEILYGGFGEGFITQYLNVTESLIQGHFRTHIYHSSGKTSANTLKTRITDLSLDPSFTHVQPPVPGDEQTEPAKQAQELDDLRRSLDKLLAPLKLSMSQKWKGLPKALSFHRHTIVNWPIDVSLPYETTKKKGIAGLSSEARKLWVSGIADPLFPIHLAPWPKDASPKDTPVIKFRPDSPRSPPVCLYEDLTASIGDVAVIRDKNNKWTPKHQEPIPEHQASIAEGNTGGSHVRTTPLPKTEMPTNDTIELPVNNPSPAAISPSCKTNSPRPKTPVTNDAAAINHNSLPTANFEKPVQDSSDAVHANSNCDSLQNLKKRKRKNDQTEEKRARKEKKRSKNKHKKRSKSHISDDSDVDDASYDAASKGKGKAPSPAQVNNIPTNGTSLPAICVSSELGADRLQPPTQPLPQVMQYINSPLSPYTRPQALPGSRHVSQEINHPPQHTLHPSQAHLNQYPQHPQYSLGRLNPGQHSQYPQNAQYSSPAHLIPQTGQHSLHPQNAQYPSPGYYNPGQHPQQLQNPQHPSQGHLNPGWHPTQHTMGYNVASNGGYNNREYSHGNSWSDLTLLNPSGTVDTQSPRWENQPPLGPGGHSLQWGPNQPTLPQMDSLNFDGHPPFNSPHNNLINSLPPDTTNVGPGMGETGNQTGNRQAGGTSAASSN